MALNKQQIRDFVRSHLDIETEDLPDAVLDVFIAEGFQRIVLAEKRWPFYVKRWTLNTVASTASYDIPDSFTDVKEISSIVGPLWTLKWIGIEDADRKFPTSVVTESDPVYWSVENETLYLWPTPADAVALTVKGYRKPTDFGAAAAGDEPDLPDEFHNTVAIWALAKAYMQQDDPEMASVYERQFADELGMFRRRFHDTPAPQPLVMNGTGHRPFNTSLGLRYDWEF